MRIHILGACGTFMGGLALLARRAGHTVTGQDRHTYPPMSTQLAAEGIGLIEGYDAGHLDPKTDLVLDIKSKTLVLYPDKMYNEASIMGGMMKVETVINGKKGVRKQMGKTMPMDEEQIEKQIFGDLYDIFNPVPKEKYQFQYLKEEKINGNTFDVIYTFDSQKNWVKFFINRETRFVEIEEKLSQFPGQQGTARTVNSDFKTIEGIPFAFQAKTYVKDKVVMETTTKQITVNPKIDLSLFKIEEEKK